MSTEAAEIRERLLAWYEREKRDFPWRGTADPYAVLVSEVMLQQTQASRVADRFPRFMSRFPSADALARADAGHVLAEWSGLGYNRRALALQAAASVVARDGWPRDVPALERLPGVGPYTARAIASLAFGKPVGVVDTNVRRWLSRRFGAPASALQRVADQLATAGDPRDAAAWTHASMEFGARVCRSRAPACARCPLADGCPASAAPPSVPVPRQPRFEGSARAYRGALVRLLAATPGGRLGIDEAAARLAELSPRIGPALAAHDLARVIASLERDGLVSSQDGTLRLGARRSLESAGGTLARARGDDTWGDAAWRS